MHGEIGRVSMSVILVPFLNPAVAVNWLFSAARSTAGGQRRAGLCRLR
jgi:hypothetical protein